MAVDNKLNGFLNCEEARGARITQTVLAEMLGCSSSSINKVTNGKADLPKKAVERFNALVVMDPGALRQAAGLAKARLSRARNVRAKRRRGPQVKKANGAGNPFDTKPVVKVVMTLPGGQSAELQLDFVTAAKFYEQHKND